MNPRARLQRLAYSWLWRAALPWLALKLACRNRRSVGVGAGNHWLARLGKFDLPARTRPRVWVHAVSVGEVQAASPLVRALLAALPNHEIVMTTTTATGAAAAGRALGDAVVHLPMPFDLPGAVDRFLSRVEPGLVVILETELWPNLLAACESRGVPVALVNARLSPRSWRAYARLPSLTREMLASLSLIAAQSAGDASRFRALGAPADRLQVVGNLKFDIKPPGGAIEAGEALRKRLGRARPTWIAASTHEGEEALVLEAHEQIRRRWPDALLLLVPRHPERFPAVAGLCRSQGLPLALRSAPTPADGDAAVFLGDSMGEMFTFYAASDVAYIGGSLVPTGGHNPLEPAAVGVPVLAGPHVFNFEATYALLEQAGALGRVPDVESLATSVAALFDSPAERARRAANASAIIDDHGGASQRVVDGLVALLSHVAPQHP